MLCQEQLICMPRLPYSYHFNRHSYSAIRNSSASVFDHAQRPRLVMAFTREPRLCTTTGWSAWPPRAVHGRAFWPADRASLSAGQRVTALVYARIRLAVDCCDDIAGGDTMTGSGHRRWVAVDVEGLILRVIPVADSDPEEMADLAGRLRAVVLGVDAVSVVPLIAGDAPEGAKGFGSLPGWLAVQFGSLDGLRAVVAAVRGWTSRTGRTVEVSIGGDALKVTGVTSEQQEKIIEAWLAHHALGS